MKYQGKTYPLEGGEMGVEAWMTTVARSSKQTPKPGTTLAHPAATQLPPRSFIESTQLRHWSLVLPEQVAQPGAQGVQRPEMVSKYWEEEHVWTQVAVRDLTGRDGGHVRQMSNRPLQVAQSG